MKIDIKYAFKILEFFDNYDDSVFIDLGTLMEEFEVKPTEEGGADRLLNHLLHLDDIECFSSTDSNKLSESIRFDTNGDFWLPDTGFRLTAQGRALKEFLGRSELNDDIKSTGLNAGKRIITDVLSSMAVQSVKLMIGS